MDITIYTSTGCVWCTRMKELMERANQNYTEVVWNELTGDEQQALTEQYPDMRSFPIAIIDGVFYKGLVDVAKLFLQEGLVTAPKKEGYESLKNKRYRNERT